MREGRTYRQNVQTFTNCAFFLHKLLLSLFSDSQKAAFITLRNISFNRQSICSLALLAAGCTCQCGSSVPEEMTRQFIPQHTDSRDVSARSLQLSFHSHPTGGHLHPGQSITVNSQAGRPHLQAVQEKTDQFEKAASHPSEDKASWSRLIFVTQNTACFS